MDCEFFGERVSHGITCTLVFILYPKRMSDGQCEYDTMKKGKLHREIGERREDLDLTMSITSHEQNNKKKTLEKMEKSNKIY